MHASVLELDFMVALVTQATNGHHSYMFTSCLGPVYTAVVQLGALLRGAILNFQNK